MHEHIELAQLLIRERSGNAQRPENRHRRELNLSRRRPGRRKKR